jgi:hypothetical protein
MAYDNSNDDDNDDDSSIWKSKVLFAAPATTDAAVVAKNGKPSRMHRAGSSKRLTKSCNNPRSKKQSRKRCKHVSFASSDADNNNVQCSIRLVARLNKADAWPTTSEKDDMMNSLMFILDEYKQRLENAHVETEDYFDALWRLYTMPPLSSTSSGAVNNDDDDDDEDKNLELEQLLSQARRTQFLDDLKTLQTSPIASQVRGLEPYILANHFHNFRQGHLDHVLAVQTAWRQEQEQQRQDYQPISDNDYEQWIMKLRNASLETSSVSGKFCLGMAQNDARSAARAMAVPWNRSSTSSSSDEED